MNILVLLVAFLSSKYVHLTNANDEISNATVAAENDNLPNKDCNCTETPANKRRKLDPDEFLKLSLNERSLRGSRWTLEQKNVIDVYHSIEVIDATLINTNELILRVEFNLRQQWHAKDLELPKGLFKDTDPPGAFITASEEALRDMWSPESFISTSRESNMNTMGTSLNLVHIFINKTILFKVRMFTKVACSSSFQWYPLDIQTCDLAIESYKYHDDIVRYHWTDDKFYRPVIVHNRRLFQYELQMPPKYYSGYVERGGRGTKYSFVRIKFRFERKLGNNIIQVYTPTVLVVVLSWFSFWLGLDAIPGRISLLVTCMLTLVTMHSGMKTSIPPVHYITMMDVWYVSCMAFVFTAMCEFIVVKYIHWRHEQKKRTAEKKYQEETRQKLYNIFQQHSTPEGNQKLITKDYGEGDKNRNTLPILDTRTVLASSYWAAAAATSGLQDPSKNFMSNQLLQSILVGGMIGEDGTGNMNEIQDGRQNDQNKNVKIDEKEDGIGCNAHPMWVQLDRFCRGFLPFLFCIFNAIYWPILFNISEVQELKNI